MKGGRSTIYRGLRIAQGGGTLKNSHFATHAKPPLLSNKDIKNISKQINDNSGRAYGSSDIKAMMIYQVKWVRFQLW